MTLGPLSLGSSRMASLLPHCLLMALAMLLSMASSLMVEKNAPLSVYKGRVAYIHPHDLILSVPEGDLCKVEVITNDPMSQRVGKLHPLVSLHLNVLLIPGVVWPRIDASLTSILAIGLLEQ